MTLAVRLFVLVLIGALGAGIMHHYLWPTNQKHPAAKSTVENPFVAFPPLGVYTSKSEQGAYRLTIGEARQAKLVFTDRKGKKASYKGVLADGKIVWQQALRGKKWVDLEAHVDDAMEFSAPSTVLLREGRFELMKK